MGESGDNWYFVSDYAQSIDVIEPVARPKNRGKKKRKKVKAKKVPFGLARALEPKQTRALGGRG
jgi:hypothetical protein